MEINMLARMLSELEWELAKQKDAAQRLEATIKTIKDQWPDLVAQIPRHSGKAPPGLQPSGPAGTVAVSPAAPHKPQPRKPPKSNKPRVKSKSAGKRKGRPHKPTAISPYPGVYRSTSKVETWQGTIWDTEKKKTEYVGTFDLPEQAAAAVAERKGDAEAAQRYRDMAEQKGKSTSNGNIRNIHRRRPHRIRVYLVVITKTGPGRGYVGTAKKIRTFI